MTFTSDELERYARHIVLPQFGGDAQQRLKTASVLIVGAGGLGSPVIQYLAAAGVGKLVVVDDDEISLSNLQRQTIFPSDAIGKPKAEVASRFVSALNPNVKVAVHCARLDASNAEELIAGVDLVADGSDNFDTRYLVAEICEKLEKPLVTAAVGQFDGSITTLKPYAKNTHGDYNPRYTDIFPRSPAQEAILTCEQAGILGALTGVVGSMQAMEIIKELTAIGEGLVGRLLMYDSKSCCWTEIQYKRTDG